MPSSYLLSAPVHFGAQARRPPGSGSTLLTFACLVPILAGIGILATFKIAGPLYRFEIFLKKVAAGEHPEPCHTRTGDELQDFCELLNTVTEPLRRRQGADADAGGDPAREAA